jgi:biopolymer transport protein ExbB
MNLFFLQIDTARNLADRSATALSAIGSGAHMNIMDLLYNGGVLMIPLALLLVLAIFFFFERWIALKQASNVDPNFMNIIRDHVVTNNVTAARSLAKNTNNAVAKIIDKGLQRIGKPIDAIEKSMENVGRLEVYKMERNLSVLSLDF